MTGGPHPSVATGGGGAEWAGWAESYTGCGAEVRQRSGK
jgi:hypothetical protein